MCLILHTTFSKHSTREITASGWKEIKFWHDHPLHVLSLAGGSQSELHVLRKSQPFYISLSVDSTVPSDSIRSSTFPKSLTLSSNERPVVWTNAKRTTLQLSLARPAEWCLCMEGCSKAAFMLLGKQPEGSQCAVKTDFVWATVLFCLWHTGCFICHGQLFIHFDTVWTPWRAGWNSIKREKGKHSLFLFSPTFANTYLPFFSHSLLKNLSTVCAWKQLVSSLPDKCPRAGVLWGHFPGCVLLLLTWFVTLHYYTSFSHPSCSSKW